MRNAAPRFGLPKYVTYRADKPSYATKPGDNRLLITYYGTAGATVQSVAVNGQPTGAAIQSEHGLLAVTISLELPVSETRKITVVAC